MDTIDSVQLRVPKTAAFPGGRRIAAAFLSGPGRYGGELIIRELVQEADGAIGLKWPAEFKEQRQNQPLYHHDSIFVSSLTGFAEHHLESVEGEYVISFEVVPENATMYYGFSIATDAAFDQGYDVRFEPSNRKVGIHEINCASFKENEESSIYHVEGLDQRISVQAIVKKGFIDLCVNDQRTLISRTQGEHPYLRLFAQFGTARFNQAAVRLG